MLHMQLHEVKNILEHSSNAFPMLLCSGQKVMNVRLNVVWRKTATVDQRWCPGFGICYKKRGYRVEIKFIDTVIYFGSCHLNTLFILRSIHLLPRPLTWAEQTFSIHPYTSQTKPLFGEVDRRSEKDSGVVGNIQKWEMLSFMQTRGKKCQPEVQVVSQSRSWSFTLHQSLNHIVCIFHLDFICNCD